MNRMNHLRVTQLLDQWNRQQEQRRACHLCHHGSNAGEICLYHPTPRATEKARAPNGFCGPEALHLLIPSHNEATPKPAPKFAWDDWQK